MSSSKSKINIEKAIRELQTSKRYEQQDYILTELNANLPLKIEIIKNRESQQSSKKSARKSIGNKQNQCELDMQKIKNITYTTLSKTLDQKNYQIHHQQHQIQLLKKTLEDQKSKKDDRQIEESRIKCQELVRLKLKEKQHLQNLREVKMLKFNLEEIRKKYDQMSNQKNAILIKYNSLLIQNQQLTTTIATLKAEKQAQSKNNRCTELQQELTILKEQARQEHLQKESIEARANNFQKRMSQYISKFNEAQQHYNNCQIKYYKLQKDCDNLRVDKEESQQKYYNIQRQIKSEREINEDQVSKLRIKLKRLEELSNQQELSIGLLKQIEKKRYSESQQLDKLNSQLFRHRQEYLRLKDQSQMQARKWQNYIKQLTKQYSQEKEALAQQLHHSKMQMTQLNARLNELQTKQTHLNEQYNQLFITHENDMLSMQSINSKCEDLISQNERIFNHYSGLLFQKEQQIKRGRELISHLKVQLQDKGRQEQMIMDKINQLQARISQGDQYHNQRIIAMQSENNQLSSIIQKVKQEHLKELHQKEETINQITQNNIGLAEQLNKCNSERLQSGLQNERKRTQQDSQFERIKQLNQQYSSQKKYYQEKYQKQLQQYNNLSKYFHQIEQENTNLLSANTHHIIEISILKGQIAVLHSDRSKLAHTNSSDKTAEIAIINSELSYLKKEIQCLLQELNKHQLTINNLEEENKQLKAITMLTTTTLSHRQSQIKNVSYVNLDKKGQQSALQCYQRQITQKDKIISKIKTELELHVEEIRKLNHNISIAQQNYCTLIHKYQSDAKRWEQQKVELQQQWTNFNQSNEEQKRELYHSRITVAYELDNSQNTINILKKENIQLQRIFGEQIERRNGIIRQLIKEKRSLYGQFMNSQD